MRFCPKCDLCMRRRTASGKVVYWCPCGVEEPGDASDARIGGNVLGAGQTPMIYYHLIRTASFDRTNQLVERQCPNCPLDYMTQIRVGDAEIIIYTCKCGHQEGGGQAFAPPAGRPSTAPP